ncbi:MAG: HesB/IscA family protein [Myxococcaceae bacterium]
MHNPVPSQSLAGAPAASSEANEHPLSLTRAAVEQAKVFLTQAGQEANALSIRVAPNGCSGLGYDLSLGPPRPGDLTWEQDGVKLTTDPMSAAHLAGTVVDYVSSLEGAGFKFLNPQAKHTCGCGSSFSA